MGQTLLPAQLYFSSTFELADKVSLDETDSSARTHLERVRACLADGQFDEAVETLRQVMEQHGAKVIALAEGRYGSVRDYCHLRIAALPPAALSLYRSRVDPQAKALYERGVAERNAAGLRDVVEQYFCSSWGDSALFALGEIALERGDYPAARDFWAKLIQTPPTIITSPLFEQVRQSDKLPAADGELLDRWYRLANTEQSPHYELTIPPGQMIPDEAVGRLVQLWNSQGVLPKRLFYPETDLNLADVRARLVLTSILAGKRDEASDDLQALAQLHASASGRIAGRTGTYSDLLKELLQASDSWPQHRSQPAWTTFAGVPTRNYIAPEPVELGELAWQRPLEPVKLEEGQYLRQFGFNTRRVADDNRALVSYHPIIAGNLVLYSSETKIWALDAATGKPAWGPPDGDGVIFRDDEEGMVRPHIRGGSRYGAPRFTLTVIGDKLLARMGTPVTSNVGDQPFQAAAGSLVLLDLASQGRLLWKIFPDDDKWAFDGTPVSDGTFVYVAMRRSDIRPQVHVACFDLDTGKRRWRRMIAAAVTPTQGSVDEITNTLVTLHRDTLFVNTNLGAVASLSARDGAINWISLYPRAKGGSLSDMPAHFCRDLNPAVYDRGKLYVLPSDSEKLFTFDAQTGELQWDSAHGEPATAVHLVGVAEGKAIVTGDGVSWFDSEHGKLRGIWPDGPLPKGFGRGVLAGDELLWPTRQELYRFDLKTMQRRESVRFHERGVTGGNLVIGENLVLIASGDMLHAFRR